MKKINWTVINKILLNYELSTLKYYAVDINRDSSKIVFLSLWKNCKVLCMDFFFWDFKTHFIESQNIKIIICTGIIIAIYELYLVVLDESQGFHTSCDKNILNTIVYRLHSWHTLSYWNAETD